MMHRIFAVLALLIVAATPARAQEPYFGYDAFPTPQIDFSRWLFGERSRQIVGGALLMSQRDYGDQVGNTGTRRATFSTPVDEPHRVTQLRANVAITGYDVTGCAQNTTPSSVQARVIGSFFNAGTPVVGSQMDDVIALARVMRRSNSIDAADVLVVEGLAVQCTAADCSTSTQIGTTQSLGTVTQGTLVRLAVEWDQAAKTFYFQRDTDPKLSLTYTAADNLAPGTPFKQLDTRTDLANCIGSARTVGSVSAKFDNMQVNASALP
jgi:hypothetical protein